MTAHAGDLLRRFSAGETSCAPDLCRAYLPVMEGLALAGTLSTEGAGEVVAAAATEVMGRLTEAEAPAELMAMVEETVRAKIRDWIQSGKGKSSEIVAFPPEVAARALRGGLDLPALFGDLPPDKSAWMLLEAASWLPARYQSQFLLRYLNGKNYKEIADLTGTDEERVLTDLGAARRLYEREIDFYLKKQAEK